MELASGWLAMKSIVERNPFQEAPMEPFRVATVRFAVRFTVCVAIIALLVYALICVTG